MRRLALLLSLLAATASAGFVLSQAAAEDPGPTTKLQVNGRKLAPMGKLTSLGNFPAGAALTTNGRFLWTLSAGRGANDIRIVQVAATRRCKKPRRPHRARRLRGRALRRYKKARARYRKRVRRYRSCRRRRARQVGKVVQVISMPGVDGGIAMAADGKTAYVSGTPESEHADEKVAANIPGKQGDTVHVFRYDARRGKAVRAGTIDVPPPSGTALPQATPLAIPGTVPPPQNFPPTSTKPQSWPRDLAVTPDGKTLLAALNLADRAAVVDIKTKRVRYVETGRYPYGAAITPDGKRGLISNETDGTVSVIDLAGASKITDIQVGPHLSHPEGIAVDPKAPRAYVAVTHQDLIAVIDTRKLTVERTLSVARQEGNGTAPVAVKVTRDGCFLLSADSGEDAVAVFALPRSNGTTCPNKAKKKKRKRKKKARRRAKKSDAVLKHEGAVGARSRAFQLVGRVPVGNYPVAADATPARKTLVWVAAKGLGVGPNPNGPRPNSPLDSDDHINSFQYLPLITFGRAGTLAFPTDATLRKVTPLAARQIRPTNGESAPANTPIRAPGPGQKIEHVFYIVRENRTYDQVLGDDSRGDGDPKLTLFGNRITPNAHALARRFPLLDHVYANSEASIDGHFWTSAGAVSDYVNKNWHQNYGGRNRPYDFGVYAVTWPSQRFLFDRAEKDSVSYFNYGEAIAGTVPLNDKDRNDAETQEVARKTAKSDLGPPEGCFPNDASAGGTDSVAQGQLQVFDSSPPSGAPPNSESRFDCFRAHFLSQLVTGSVPAFNYLTLANDHTSGTTPGARTPFAMVAENDYALGQIVDLISHSSIWSKSLILVIEDDSQDGADHVDAHRIPALAISPYAKRGAVVHTRYDFLSFIRTLEIVTGMKSMNLFDALATPMYDTFNGNPDNAEPYTAVGPNVNLLERNTSSTPAARASKKLSFTKLDQMPQRDLDSILWKYVHGSKAKPPPPGPNASGIDR